MKLSTSNLGCFKWDIPTTIARLREYGFDGLDLRGVGGNLKPWQTPDFSTGLPDTRARMQDAGMALSCISSSICLAHADPQKMADNDEELARDAEICAALGCRQIRMFGGDLSLFDKTATESDRARVIDHAAKRCMALADRARSIAPIDLLIETHDAWTHSEHSARLLERIGLDSVGCCWDVKHTWWHAKEFAETTWPRIKRWVRNTHWKDACRHRGTDGGFKSALKFQGMLVPLGEGIIPVADALDLLTADGYNNWFTFEWEKHWHPHIKEPEEAFPAFVRFMRSTEQRLSHPQG